MNSANISLLNNAITRSEHFAKSLAWYADALKNNFEFQSDFLNLVHHLIRCSRNFSENNQAFFIAVGKSAQVASLLSSMLISVGILSRFVHPTEAFHGDLGVIGKNDIVILISNSGKSSELLQLLPGLEDRGVKTFAITSKPNSALAIACTHTLQISPFEEMCPLSQAPITSTITTLALGQLLVAATIEERNYSIEEYAKNHPGGAIGKRIFLKVDDLMLKGENLPQISPTALFLDVISCFTRFSKAALLVVNNNKFLGLISEKDLRTSMEKYHKNVFDLKAQDIMNTKPTTIKPGLLAIEVKNLMAGKTPPFNILPVVDEQGNAVGLIRLLDLIAAGL
ncbi:MAG: KpsF/GutQ family sugar-phosphate isomerase [Bdellovibrionota bacterium]